MQQPKPITPDPRLGRRAVPFEFGYRSVHQPEAKTVRPTHVEEVRNPGGEALGVGPEDIDLPQATCGSSGDPSLQLCLTHPPVDGAPPYTALRTEATRNGFPLD